MKTNSSKFIKSIVDGFQRLRGKASVYCFTIDIIPEIIYNIIVLFANKHPKEQIFIAVDCYNTRKSILDYLKAKGLNLDNEYNIRILSEDYINPKYSYTYKLIITVGINDNFQVINHLHNGSNFTLSILTKNVMNNVILDIRNILPNIETTVSDAAIKSDSIYSPVEEHRVPVILSTDDKTLYDKYTDYITTSVSIFGDLSNIEKCKHGDAKLNISSAEFRNNVAKENGWSENLDTSLDFQRQIDEIYNPNTLYERACNFYTIAKQRRDLLTDNVAKIDAIREICMNNPDKKILIISKRGEFASLITKHLNECLSIACGDYHDCIDNIVATDEMGVPITIKSGANKGKLKILGSQAVSSLNMKRFNDGLLNVLSIKNSSNPKLSVTVDIVILTSPFCDNIIDVKRRFTNIVFNGIPTMTYKVYCDATIEYNSMIKENNSTMIKVIEANENFVGYDENSGDIIL